MQLGWIDFSKTERDKVLSVIQLLQEPGAVDELGIGTIRDAFANYFFPGTSTVQTRAKYFLIVPYILQDAGSGKHGKEINKILSWIDDEEKECGENLMKGSKDGVIGSTILPDKWVVRAPSDIYWNGIKELGIFKDKTLSIKEYLIASLELKNTADNGRRSGNTDSEDDKDAGDYGYRNFWSLPDPPKGWKDNLTIDLLPNEAAFLRQQIEVSLDGTLFAYLVKNNIDINKYENFASLTAAIRYDVPEELGHMMDLANDFNNLVYLARIRYNIMLSVGQNEKALEEWNIYKADLSQYAKVDLDSIYISLKIRNEGLMTFLRQLQKAFLENNIEAADELIKKQEKDIKGKNRAKLYNTGKYDPQNWVGGERLDYRFSSAKRIISDIYEGEAAADV